MAAIKNKIKDLMHKDSPSSSTTGYDNTSNNTTSNTQHKGGAASAVKGALGGYDGTTSTGAHGTHGSSRTAGEQDVRTGMSDLDISTGNNTSGQRTGTTTGLTGKDEFGTRSHEHGHEHGLTGKDEFGTRGHEHGHEHGTRGSEYESNTTGGISQGVTRSYDNTTNEIIDSERFTKTEDHEVVIEKKAYELEHRPVQKKYVVETRFEGERTVAGKATELLSTETREVEERVVSMPTGNREIVVENVDLPLDSELVESHRVNIPHSSHQHGSTHQHGTTGSGLGSSHQHDTTGTGLGGSNTGLGGSNTGTGLGSNAGTGLGGSNTGLGGSNTGTGLGSSNTGNTGAY